MEKKGLQAVLGIALLGLSVFLLKGDVRTFWSWWLVTALLGFAAMPLTGRLFQGFEDRGWIFSRVLAIAVTGFLTWFLVSCRLISFLRITSVAVCLVFCLICVLILKKQQKEGFVCLPVQGLSLILWEEMLFYGVFLFWTYLAGFHPDAYGTEKFMDYGFMASMMRSTQLPPTDLWYSEGTLNYYYGGQYFAVFLTKITFTRVEKTYNLMRTFVAGLAFVLPFSLVFQMMKDRLEGKEEEWRISVPAAAGVTAGFAVSMAGNMHYVVYGVIMPFIQRLRGVDPVEIQSYWFPDATRYIGYHPDVDDKTIHEFPSYSFVLGDLHAHVVNIMFVLLLLGLLYAWFAHYRKERSCQADGQIRLSDIRLWKSELLMPHILLVSVLLGMFQWTNYWDFIIYYVVTGGVVVFANVVRFRGQAKAILAVTAAQALEVFGVAWLIILPFTLSFRTMVEGVAFAKHHSLPHQLLILWGLPVILVLVFLACWLIEKLRYDRCGNLYELFSAARIPDLFAVITGLCGIGLVLIPELVYVRDIYESGNARANTMFKLTYQAYILFGITMGYIIFQMITLSSRRLVKGIAALGLVCLVWTLGYLGNCIDSWFGNVLDVSAYQGLDATRFLERDFYEDAGAIHWLKEHVSGLPVTLEANGDSYTGYERVSSSTGLPTILGWYVHEWLWRSDTQDLNEKSEDVETIYTSADEETVRELLDRYKVSYVFIGSKELEKYGEALNAELLKSLGTVVYQDKESGTCIVQMRRVAPGM